MARFPRYLCPTLPQAGLWGRGGNIWGPPRVEAPYRALEGYHAAPGISVSDPGAYRRRARFHGHCRRVLRDRKIPVLYLPADLRSIADRGPDAGPATRRIAPV